MGLLSQKNALIFGLANERSIAWGISKAFQREGATLGFSYAPVMEKFARPLAAKLGATFIEACDVSSDEQISDTAKKAARYFKRIDILVHSIGYANKEDLQGHFHNTSRAGFHLAMDISVYSLIALTNAFLPILNPGTSIMCLTYYGAEKVAPRYNVMGVAKAALESTTRYLAHDLGPRKIRVNAISAGPIRTLAAAGVSGFRDMYKHFAEVAPMQENVTIEDIGNSAVFLASDLSTHITGEVLYVDAGFNIMGVQIQKE